MINFYIRNTKISLDFSFFAIILFFCTSSSEKYFIPAISACILHEVGHIVPMCILKEKIKSVTFYGAGIKIHPTREIIKSFIQDIVIMLGGPIINIVTGLLLMTFVESESFRIFAVFNITIGLFNLLPLFTLDGGTILVWIADYYGKLTGELIKVIKIINMLIGILIIGTFYLNNNINFTAIVTIIYIEVSDMVAEIKGKSIT